MGMRIICASSKVANYSNSQLHPSPLCCRIIVNTVQQINIITSKLYFASSPFYVDALYIISKNNFLYGLMDNM